MHWRILSLTIVGFFIFAGVVSAQMTSANFQIRWDSVSTTGSDTSSSASYTLRDGSGEAGGNSSSATYQVDSGYRGSIFDQIITFDLLIQGTTGQVVTNLAGTTITTATDGFAVNDYILLVQDRGGNQVSAIGKINAIGAGTITVDSLTNGGTAPAIDGNNDYLYAMDANALAMQDLNSGLVRTGVIGFEVTSDNDNGYVIQVYEDGNFRAGVDEITDVADGEVTSGSLEFGARSSDTTIATSTFDTVDSAISQTAQDIVTKTSAQFNDRSFFTVKAAIAATTTSGNYGNTLTFIASGNF